MPPQQGLEAGALGDPELAMLVHVLQHRIGEALAVFEITRRAIAALAAALLAAPAPAAGGRHLDHVGEAPQNIVGVGHAGQDGANTAHAETSWMKELNEKVGKTGMALRAQEPFRLRAF